MKYKMVGKDWTALAIIKLDPCVTELDYFFKHIAARTGAADITDDMINNILLGLEPSRRKVWVTWLLDNNIIADAFCPELGLIKQGQRFRIEGEEYILASPTRKTMCMIALSDGNRWVEAVPVKDPVNVTADELDKLIGSRSLITCKRKGDVIHVE